MLNRTFYSLQDTKTPTAQRPCPCSEPFGCRDDAPSFLNLRKKISGIGRRKLLEAFIKSAAASVIMGLAVFGLYRILSGYMATAGKLMSFVILGFIIGFGAVLYFAVIYIIKVEEINWLLDIAKRQIREI